MSIINEALKKAINDKEKSVSSILKANIEKTLGPEILVKKKSFNWGPIFVMMVLLLIAGPIVAPFLSAAVTDHSGLMPGSRLEIAGAPINTSSPTQKAQFAVEEAPLFREGPPISFQTPYLNLTGIVAANEGSYCIINDKVLKIGESVQGAQIKQINNNKVNLVYKGQDVVLYINR